ACGDGGEEELKQDLLDQVETHAGPDAYVVASSMPFRDSESPGDNPPHLLARDRYEEIVPNTVLCTGEYPTADSPRPIVFGLQPGAGLVLLEVQGLAESERAAEA